MKKYFVVILAFFTFCSNDADISTDLSEIEKDIIETEGKIEDLESKDSTHSRGRAGIRKTLRSNSRNSKKI